MEIDSIANIEFYPRKSLVHVDRLRALAAGQDVFPVTVELDLVDYCNHRCWWCVDPRHGNHRLERDFVSRLLTELRGLTVEGIVFKGGGEPMLHPDFAAIIAETRRLGFEVGIVSNGSQLLDRLQAVVEHASYMRVSVDAPAEQPHAQLHDSRDYARVVEGVRQTMHLRCRLGQRHPIVGLSFTMDYPMISLVHQAVVLADELRVDYVLFRPPFMEEAGHTSRMTPEQKVQLFEAFDRERSAYFGPLQIFVDYWISDAEAKTIRRRGPSPRRGDFLGRGTNGIEHVLGTCLASPLLAVVAADRTLYPCCNLRLLDGWSIGQLDYESGNTFRRLWQGEARCSVMKRIHRIDCIDHCTHPLGRHNEDIAYLAGPQHHRGFV